MSLSIYLTIDNFPPGFVMPQIFIRENGTVKSITREEWDRRFPDREPVTTPIQECDGTVYSAKITHNLGKMAGEAGIYKPLWRPEEIGIEIAAQLIKPLQKGLALLQDKPDKFKEFNPSNGWGDYEGLVRFVGGYLEACQQYPNATVSVWR